MARKSEAGPREQAPHDHPSASYVGGVAIDRFGEVKVRIEDVDSRRWTGVPMERILVVKDPRPVTVRLLDGPKAGQTAVARFGDPHWSNAYMRKLARRLQGRRRAFLRGRTAFTPPA